MNERQPNLSEHGDFSGWQRRTTRLEWLSEGYQSKLLAVLLKGGRCNFWDLLDCDDRISPWWASRVGPQHDTVMFSMSFNSYASLAIFFIIPVLFCFVFEHEPIYYTSVSCVWFLLPHVSLQSNWVWKPSKLRLSISFTLWGLSSLLTLE